MDGVRDDFVRAAEMADAAGFDLIELHFAHGYLLSSFISPLTNQRDDEYGGSVENRMRFPLEILDSVRSSWPTGKPISVRISAVDWAPDGLRPEDAVEIGRMLKEHACDIVDVSAGQTVPHAKPVYGRQFQTPFADRIRHEAASRPWPWEISLRTWTSTPFWRRDGPIFAPSPGLIFGTRTGSTTQPKS